MPALFGELSGCFEFVGEGMRLPKGRNGEDASDHWATPRALYEELNREFVFDFDPCPLHSTFDGLQVDWGHSNFVNPPYNRVDKPKFIQKAWEQMQKQKLSVLLIPAAVSTKQFHGLILPYAEIRYLRGRVRFEGVNTKGEFVTTKVGKHDSMIVIFRPKQWQPHILAAKDQ